MVSPPRTEVELLERARGLSGATLGELARRAGAEAPLDLRRAKGFTGQLVEQLLGATAASRAEPDFPGLGVELKTLPVGRRGRPAESTFVATVDLGEMGRVEWATCRVRAKLSRVLWVPVEGDRVLSVPARRVGEPLLWSPDPDQEAQLRADWEELAGEIGRGGIESLSAHRGLVLQVRPKAANARSRRQGTDEEGLPFATLPRGFYLRASFTAEILRRNYALPRGSFH